MRAGGIGVGLWGGGGLLDGRRGGGGRRICGGMLGLE